jgi:glycosyltransferase involved in cell wall biosynthesis
MQRHVLPPRRLLFLVNDLPYYVSHRLAIGKGAISAGFEVHVAGPGDPPREIKEIGIIVHRVHLSRKGMNPFAELRSAMEIFHLFRCLRPDIVHLITIKPYLYGGIIARLAGVPAVVAAVAGLGGAFTGTGLGSRLFRLILRPFYRYAFGHPRQRVIFQNQDDRALIIQWAGLDPQKAVLIRGSGVDLSEFPICPEPEGIPIIVFAARLLRDKGINEFVEAARLLHQRGVQARFQVVGAVDNGNATSIGEEVLRAWRQEGAVEFLGHRKDIPNVYAQAHIVCLPSYYGEGLP